MDLMNSLEKDCRSLNGLFQQIINDMKKSTIVWEDFNNKAIKLQMALKSVAGVIESFLDAFQKVADLANCSRGATRDIGAALTRLCFRHKSIENRMRTLTTNVGELLVEPIQEKLEEWKKNTLQLDKDHSKEYKKLQNEIKKESSNTIRLQKRNNKKGQGNKNRLDDAWQDVNDKYILLEETEKCFVRNAMIDERSRFCFFISCLKPIMDHEIGMLTEVTHLQEIVDVLYTQAIDPESLPQSSEQVILDLKAGRSLTADTTTPSDSPLSLDSHLGSHKSSVCSVNSSSSSSSLQSGAGSHHQVAPPQTISLIGHGQMLPPPSSMSSEDSGYTSQDVVVISTTDVLQGSSQDFVQDGNKTIHLEMTKSDFPEGSILHLPLSSSDQMQQIILDSSSFPSSSSLIGGRSYNTISYSREHRRPTVQSQMFEPMNSSTTGSNQSLPSSFSQYAVPCQRVALGTRLPLMTAEDIEMMDGDDVYNRRRHSMKKEQPSMTSQPMMSLHVAPPTVPTKYYSALPDDVHKTPIYANTNVNQKNEDVQDDRQQQQILRSFSFPFNSDILPSKSYENLNATTAVTTELKYVGHHLESQKEVTCRSATLPRLSEFKVPELPKSFSSCITAVKNPGPPTLPKHKSVTSTSSSSSRVLGKPPPPPPPMRCNSMKSSSSVERQKKSQITSAGVGGFPEATSGIEMTKTDLIAENKKKPSNDASSSSITMSHVLRDEKIKTDFNSTDGQMEKSRNDEMELPPPSSTDLMPPPMDLFILSPRQQAPPSDDLCLPTELPLQLVQEVLELHSPMQGTIMTKVKDEAKVNEKMNVMIGEEVQFMNGSCCDEDEDEDFVCEEGSLLEMIIERGVALRRTVSNDRSAPRLIVD